MTHTNTDWVLDLLHDRRSVRQYLPNQVPEESIALLIDAAISAPSAVNAQPWAFGIIQDRNLLTRYADEAKALYLTESPVAAIAAIPPSTLEHLRAILAEPGYDVFHGAGTLIVIYATSVHDVPDCYLAAENLMLAACAMGLGTCPIGLAAPLLDRPETKAELGIDPSTVVALPIVVGVPAGHTRATSRRPAHILYRR